MKKVFSTYNALCLTFILLLLGSPHHSIAQDNQIDKKLITAARLKAKGMGYNPITLYTDEKGHVVFTEGNMLSIRNGQSGIAEGDMVVNVGHRDANVAGSILKNGEYGIVKNGKFEKASDKIGGIQSSSYLWLIALVGAGLFLFIIIAIRKKRKVTTDNSETKSQAISPPKKIENKPQNKLRDVILVVDAKTLEWLKGKSRDEMIGFALNSCKVIADDVWTQIESWVQASGAVPSIFNMPGAWDPSKCAEVIHQAKSEYKNLTIAVRTGTTGFGGKIAVALCMND